MGAREGIDFLSGLDNNELYKVYPFLREYEGNIGNPSIDDVMGEGFYGVVIDGGKFQRVYKLGRSKEFSDSLREEYRSHLRFYMASKDIKEKSNGKYNNFRIPEVIEVPFNIKGEISGEELFIYEMEKIKGNNLLSHLIKTELESIGVSIDVSKHHDSELETIYKNMTGGSIDILRNGDFLQLGENARKFMKSVKNGVRKGVGDPFTSYLFFKYFPQQYEQVSEMLFALKKAGFKHTDLHAKNIMISYENGQPIVYLIDYGIVDIRNNIN